MGILVITTGGTIGALPYDDPVHPPEFSTMPEPGHDLVREALTRDFADYATRCVALEPRDSKLIDDRYRADLLDHIEAAAEPAVLVTHGTDTILQSADFMHAQSAARASFADKHVILTGSMIPLSNGVGSDGHANLAFALACLAAPPGDRARLHLARPHMAPLHMARINVVLCDFDASDTWRPRLYPIGTQAWTKFYDTDGRYNRIVAAPAR